MLGIPHYIFVSVDKQNRLLVADPLKGVKHTNLQQLQKMMLDKKVLAIRNTPEHPVDQFDIKKLPWFKSGRMMGRMPVIRVPAPQQDTYSSIY